MRHTIGTGHKNVELRTNQYRASFDPERYLALACSLVAAKIGNCRTLLRRNWRGNNDQEKAPPGLLSDLQADIRHVLRATSTDVRFSHRKCGKYWSEREAVFRGISAPASLNGNLESNQKQTLLPWPARSYTAAWPTGGFDEDVHAKVLRRVCRTATTSTGGQQ